MSESTQLDTGNIETLILTALVRKLMEKGALSSDDVRALLLDATENLDVLGDKLTPAAAQRIVQEDLAPAFFPQ